MADENSKPKKPKRSYEENLALLKARHKPGPVVLPVDLMQVATARIEQLPLWNEDLRGVPSSPPHGWFRRMAWPAGHGD